jgi:hypothetical protein
MKRARAKHSKLGPWQIICTFACWYALEERCRCKCGGANHGRGVSKEYAKLDDFQGSEHALRKICKPLLSNPNSCGNCLLLTLPVRGLQLYPECLQHLKPETCGGPFLPTKKRLDALEKVLQNVADDINQKLEEERGRICRQKLD